MIYNTSPTYKGFFLPNLSSKGPYNNWPAASPVKKLDKESETCAVVVWNDFAIAVKPGKYISIENGPSAVSEPSMIMVRK